LMGAQCKKSMEKLGDFSHPTLLHLACRSVQGQESYEDYDLCRVDENENYTEVATPFSPEVPFRAWKILVQFLVSRDLDLNAQDGDGITPLWYLVREGGNLNRVQFLYDMGAILDIPASNGETVLHTCAYGQEVSSEVVEFIV
jgi:ankyrin repeat protein